MSSDFCKLSDIANVQGGFAFKSADFSDSGVAVVKIANIQPPSVSLSGADRIPHEKLKGLERFELHDGDVLMAMTGATVGKVGRFRRTEPAYLNQRVARISAVKGKQFDDFVYAVVSLPGFDGLIEGVSAGSAQANISATGIGSVGIRRLSDDEQIRIGAVARTLDDRITLLRETNATLEAIAQALFKSWFVDFDPVRAKQEGRAPEGMSDATAALFPDGFEESELGLVPRGWRVAQFADFIERQSVGKKYDQKSAKTAGSVPILDQGKSGIIGFHDDKPGVTASLDEPVVVFANHTCYMRLITFPFSVIQNVLPFKGKGVDTVWAYYATQGRVKFSEYKGHWPDFAIEKAPLPDEQLTVKFREVVDPLMRRIQANDEQAKNLAEVRDTLLPRLISGQLRLPEAEAQLEGALA
jgi:type I restriction enzyme S subunit